MSLFIRLLLVAVLGGAVVGATPALAATPAATAAAHYRTHGDAASLRRAAPLLVIGMPRREVQRLFGTPVYSPTAFQDYYPTGEVDGSNGFTLTLVVNYRPDATLEWYFIDFIGE